MYFVYILRSISNPKQTYIGFTNKLRKRFQEHNNGESSHSSKYIPWKIEAYFALTDRKMALKLERYFKSGSGKAFINRRILKIINIK